MFVSAGHSDISICMHCFTFMISVLRHANTAIKFSVVLSFKIHCILEYISFA